MRKLCFLLIFIFAISSIFAEDPAQTQDIRAELANALVLDNFYISGLTAWDRMSLSSIETKMVIKGSLPDKENQYISFVLGVKRPVNAVVYQLDQIDVELDTSGSSFFYGIYNLWGFNQIWHRGKLDYGYFIGPSLDYFYQKPDYLLSVGVDGGIHWSLLMGDHVYSGTEIGAGLDFWGNHSIGDDSRYDGTVNLGYNLQCSFFMGWH